MTTEANEQTLTEQAQTEAAEIKQDIKETKDEAKEAREAGDTERADKLEKRVEAMEGQLGDIASTLKKLAERPFAPAPAAKEETTDDKAKTEEKVEEKSKEKVHRFGSRRWFGDRAYED